MTEAEIEKMAERLEDVADAVRRLINGAFRRDGERLESDKHPRFSIPCRPEYDDDMVALQGISEASAMIRAQAAEIERLREALKPFAKAGELFGPLDPEGFDMLVYNPAAGGDYALCGNHLRTARDALAKP